MLATEVVQEIDRLLKQGQLSRRKIAARLGVSRGTVNAIAQGRRGLHGKNLIDERSTPRHALAAPVRCPCCGYRIYEPCLICRARQHRHRQRVLHLLSRIEG